MNSKGYKKDKIRSYILITRHSNHKFNGDGWKLLKWQIILAATDSGFTLAANGGYRKGQLPSSNLVCHNYLSYPGNVEAKNSESYR